MANTPSLGERSDHMSRTIRFRLVKPHLAELNSAVERTATFVADGPPVARLLEHALCELPLTMAAEAPDCDDLRRMTDMHPAHIGATHDRLRFDYAATQPHHDRS